MPFDPLSALAVVDIDPLSALAALPILGPIIAYLLIDSRQARKDHQSEVENLSSRLTDQLTKQREAWVSQVDRIQSAYQELAGKVQDNFSHVVTENTAATRGLEKAVETLVRRSELNSKS